MENFNNQQPQQNYQPPQYAPNPQPQQAPPAPQYAPPAPQYAPPQNFAPNVPPQQFTPNGQPIYVNVSAPVAQLSTNRGLIKFILLTIITFGIYAIVAYSKASTDINIIASRYDGKKTAHFCLMTFVFAPLTLGIYSFIWFHGFSARIGKELQRRGISYSFGAADFWLWNILGTLIFVGPFIYVHKLFKALNLLSENYNKAG